MAPKINQNRCQFGVLGPPGASWGRLGPLLERVGPHFGPKVPTHRRSHNRRTKTLENQGGEGWGRQQRATPGGQGKTADSGKSMLKPLRKG